MNVKTDITTSEKSNILVIPIQASGKRKIDDKTAEKAFIVRNGKAHLTEITSGVSSDTEIEIISGIAEGDTLIIGPYRILSKLKDGQLVNFTAPEQDTSSQSFQPRRILRTLKKRV